METSIKRARYTFFNTLSCVVKGLESFYTTVDLRNEGCVTGKVKSVDSSMNMELEDAVFYDPRGLEHPFSSFFIRARLIRYVHIPKEVSAEELARNVYSGMVRQKQLPKSTFKMRRAKKYQQQIVASIQSADTSST